MFGIGEKGVGSSCKAQRPRASMESHDDGKFWSHRFHKPCALLMLSKVMIATLPSSAHHIQERLLGLESKIPDLPLYQTELRVPDDTYTASLGKQTLNFLGSDSPNADKIKWLAPHLLKALGHDCPEQGGCPSPSWRMIPKPTENAQEASIAISQFDNISF